jgi:nucleoid-associated protein YgaU
MKRILPLLAIIIALTMLIGCGSKEVVDDTPAPAPAPRVEPVVEEAPVVEESPVAVTDKPKPVEKDLPEVYEEPVPEDVWVKYMIQPNDYLTKIAKKEYGVVSMWRSIWDWNHDLIGDNPDLIYPFEELSLKKDASEAVEVCFEYVDYTVEKDQTLWCIAEKVYGNSYAWIIILRDNLDVLGTDYDSITPGMVLKIRTEI